MFRSIYERGGRPTTPYSEIAATIQKLKDKGRQSDETDKFLQRVLINSEVTTKRDALLDANAVVVVAGHLRAHDCASTQQYAAGCVHVLGALCSHVHRILLNLSQYDRGRLAMASCGSWDCVSYRHACPLFYLLQLALTSADVIVKRLETIHSIPQDNFARTLSQLLWTRCSHYGLTITTNAAMSADQAGVLESGGSNLHLVFACAINSKLAVALRVEQYNVTANQAQVEAQSSKYKSQQKFDENGKRVAVTCSTCAKSIKEKDKAKCLSCASDGCVEIYHVRCSRWAKIVDVNARDHAFYCDGCLPGVPLQYLDFVATEMSNRSVLTKLDFDILNVARPDKVDVCMLRAPTTNALVGIGDMKYVCHGAKDGTAIVQVKFFLRQCSSMCYNTTSNNVVATTTVAMPPFSFPFLKSTVPPTTLSLHALTLWPTAQLVPVNDSMYLAKTIADLEQASLYEFDGRDERFAIGSNDGTEIWSALQPSRAKCMKMITEATATARPARKHRREKKPHVERKLEK
ncbi:hypothetical protein DYB32_001498 [Aphanomyces invadans]|uniref:Zinc finger PHD-type domain-containing protein n=1 Tax=Aphanomyces invadans TaxID=157072 RepID=A0A418B651_9STRA|nr:hypothetical protein DYB32_001498 [Aphanomyces invadans]